MLNISDNWHQYTLVVLLGYTGKTWALDVEDYQGCTGIGLVRDGNK